MLHAIIANYELSGNGDGQKRDDDNTDWGKTNLVNTQTIDGDNRGSFLTLGEKNQRMKEIGIFSSFGIEWRKRGWSNLC